MAEKRPRCPICGKPQDDRFRPFCGLRCSDIDLGRWLAEGYATPGGPANVPQSGSDE